MQLWNYRNLVQLDVMFLFMHRHLTMHSFGVAMQVQLANDTRKMCEIDSNAYINLWNGFKRCSGIGFGSYTHIATPKLRTVRWRGMKRNMISSFTKLTSHNFTVACFMLYSLVLDKTYRAEQHFPRSFKALWFFSSNCYLIIA